MLPIETEWSQSDLIAEQENNIPSQSSHNFLRARQGRQHVHFQWPTWRCHISNNRLAKTTTEPAHLRKSPDELQPSQPKQLNVCNCAFSISPTQEMTVET
jgi:hypothetical protein